MATAPYFHWPPHSSSSTGGAPDSDVVAGFGSGAPEMAALTAPPATAAAADTTALVLRDHRAASARPRMRRSSSGSGKHQAGGGGGAKKPPQRGLGVAELERLRCGGDPLRELAGVVAGDAGVQVHRLMHCNHHLHLHTVPAASAFDARSCQSTLLAVQPPPAPSRPAGSGCYVHHPAANCCQRAPALAPVQQYFMDRWGRPGPGFAPTGAGAGGECHAQLPPPVEPEHPSSQNTIWRPAASSASCLQSGHRCDLCARRMTRAFTERDAPPPPPAAPTSPTATTVPDYSIYDLAAAMATARQGDAFAVQDTKRGALPGEAPSKEVIREIEFFPAASSTHRTGGPGPGPDDESELVAPAMSSSYCAGGCENAAPPLDLSLKL